MQNKFAVEGLVEMALAISTSTETSTYVHTYLLIICLAAAVNATVGTVEQWPLIMYNGLCQRFKIYSTTQRQRRTCCLSHACTRLE